MHILSPSPSRTASMNFLRKRPSFSNTEAYCCTSSGLLVHVSLCLLLLLLCAWSSPTWSDKLTCFFTIAFVAKRRIHLHSTGRRAGKNISMDLHMEHLNRDLKSCLSAWSGVWQIYSANQSNTWTTTGDCSKVWCWTWSHCRLWKSPSKVRWGWLLKKLCTHWTMQTCSKISMEGNTSTFPSLSIFQDTFTWQGERMDDWTSISFEALSLWTFII